WFEMLPSLPSITIALETSVLAIFIGQMGRIREDMTMVREGLRLYTRGLQELQNALWHPNLMYRALQTRC
ncbi:hypothetical protein BJ878DRAFT_420375, partial [Calycina marina]